MTAGVSTIAIELEAQTAALKQGFAESRQAIAGLGQSMSGSVAVGLAKFHAGLAAVKGALGAVRGAIEGVLSSMAGIAETENFADRIGIASDQLRILNYAAEQTGASAGTMQMALQRMTRRISEASTGSGEAVGALNELGLSAEYLAGLSPDKQFGAIADAMQNVSSQGDKVRLAMKLFDSEGVALVNTLAGGSAGLDEFGAKAQQMGLLLGDQGDKVRSASDAIANMQKAWHGMVQQIATLVAPWLEKIANFITRIVEGFNKLFGRASETAETLGGEASKAAAAFVPPVDKEAIKAAEKAAKEAEKRAKEIVRTIKKDFAEVAASPEKGIGAVTLGSAAGFSAVYEAQRRERDLKRRDEERNALLTAIKTALEREGLSMVEVEID